IASRLEPFSAREWMLVPAGSDHQPPDATLPERFGRSRPRRPNRLARRAPRPAGCRRAARLAGRAPLGRPRAPAAERRLGADRPEAATGGGRVAPRALRRAARGARARLRVAGARAGARMAPARPERGARLGLWLLDRRGRPRRRRA